MGDEDRGESAAGAGAAWEAEERFRRAFEQAAIGMALTAPDGRFLLVNEALCRMVGLTAEELRQSGFPSITHPDDLPHDLEHRDRMLAGVIDRFSTEKRYRHRDGHWVWVLLSTGLVRDPAGTPMYFVSQMVDISDRRALEDQLRAALSETERVNAELRAANTVKTEFVAIASHELRTPLVTIGGFSRLLAEHWDEIDDDERRHFAGRIDHQAGRLSRLVEDLLTASRLEAGAVVPRPQPVVLVNAVSRAVGELGFTDASVTVNCPAELHCRVDPDHLHQMLLNYLSNGVKYGRGEVVLEASADTGTGGVEVRVHDDGPGVPGAFVDQLFKSFARGEGAGGTPGSGLGLAIVWGLAEANGAHAWYQPREPHGSTFALWLPAAG